MHVALIATHAFGLWQCIPWFAWRILPEHVDCRFIVFFIILWKESGQSHKLQHERTSTDCQAAGRKISATGTDWNSNPTDSWVEGAEWGGFNIKGPIPKPMLHPSAGSGKCQACWRQLECTLTMTKSAASHLIDGFINEGYLTGEKVGFITSAAAITSLCLHCFNSIMIQRQDKWADWLTWDTTDEMNIAYLAVMRQLGNFRAMPMFKITVWRFWGGLGYFPLVTRKPWNCYSQQYHWMSTNLRNNLLTLWIKSLFLSYTKDIKDILKGLML